MKIFSAMQMRGLDKYSLSALKITSVQLMEQAADAFVNWFVKRFPEDQPVYIFCGSGNNGGDGLAAARMLSQKFYNVTVFLCKISDALSSDAQVNLERLKKIRSVPIRELKDGDALPDLPKNAIVVDAIFGSGLSKKIENFWSDLVKYLSLHQNFRVAIDVPSGLHFDKHSEGTVFHATHTFTFELPKLAFFFAENQDFTGEWTVGAIGLSQFAIEKAPVNNHLADASLVTSFLRSRKKFDHKGIYGHALLIAGGYGKMGAAILAAKACLRTGCGLVTVHAPRCGYEILQIGFPEAMVSIDPHQFCFTEPPNLLPYKAIGVGCGIGVSHNAEAAFGALLERVKTPLVIDADGLNILANKPEYLSLIPKNSILTPHPKEFDRLFGDTENDFARHNLQVKKAQELDVFIILKGAYTCIACPDGISYFNPTGNPGMATAGSGDVLTGIITSLLAQGYDPKEAAILAVYLHGLAGDIALKELGQEALLASDIIQFIGKAFKDLRLG